MNDENKEIKKNNIILMILTITICILVGGGFFFWLGTLYAEGGEKKEQSFEEQKETDNEEKENKDEEQIKIDNDIAKKLMESLVFVDFLNNYSANQEIKYENLTHEDVFYTIIKKIMVEKKFTEETFDNSEGHWYSDKQVIINLNSINEELEKIFGKVENEYLPETFEYSLYYFEKSEDKYIGKPMITGFVAEPGYIYIFDNYELNKTEVIINVVGAYYQPGAGYYRNENEENIIITEEINWDLLENEIIKNKEKLNNLQYIFEFKENNFIFKSIRMK